MRQTLLQERVADISKLFVLQLLHDLKGQTGLAMRCPRALQIGILVIAHPEREPDAVLDLFDVERWADPDRAGRKIANGIDAGNAGALLVVGDRALSGYDVHGGY